MRFLENNLSSEREVLNNYETTFSSAKSYYMNDLWKIRKIKLQKPDTKVWSILPFFQIKVKFKIFQQKLF